MNGYKDIPGFAGLYKINRKGDVLVVASKTNLKDWMNWNGYKKVTLNKNGVKKNYPVHRLVAMTYLKNPNSLPMVHHKNGNKKDNRVGNLKWSTYSENRNATERLKKGDTFICDSRGVGIAAVKMDRWNSVSQKMRGSW